jgi:hypothetical protein
MMIIIITNTNTPFREGLLEKVTACSSNQEIPCPFLKSEGLLLCSPETATGCYNKPDEYIVITVVIHTKRNENFLMR